MIPAFYNRSTRQSIRCAGRLFASLVFAVTIAKLATAAEFIPLGFPISWNIYSQEVGVAEDGSVIVGGASAERSIYRWTPQSGTQLFLHDAGCRGCLSGDGSTVVGWRYTPNGSEAIKITEIGIEVLPSLSANPRVDATVISQDGSTIFGWFGDSQDINVVRWTQDGVFLVPNTGIPKKTSANGDVLLSTSRLERWTAQDGPRNLPVPGSPAAADSFGLSSDGRWAVGRIRPSGGATQNQAVRWDGLSDPERLLPASVGWGAIGLDVTRDGSLVVGTLYPSNDSSSWQAGIWTAETGMVSLQDLLVTEHGLGEVLDGWRLTGVYDVTDDGRFMVGHAINPAGSNEAFFVDLKPIPEPSSAALALVALVPLAVWRTHRARAGDHPIPEAFGR